MVPDPESRALSILVVDDYPDCASSLAALLATEGFAARTARSGAEALALLNAERSDIVVFEPRTVGYGWEIARQMRAPGSHTRTLVVAYTTDSTPAGRRAAHAAGVESYLIKPEDPTVLVGIIREHQQLAGGGRWRADA